MSIMLPLLDYIAESVRQHSFLLSDKRLIAFLMSISTSLLIRRYARGPILAIATVLVGGCIATSLILDSFYPSIVHVIRGYALDPNGAVKPDPSASLLYGIAWIIGCAIMATMMAYRDGNLFDIFSRSGGQYSLIPGNIDPAEKRKIAPMSYQAPPPVSPDAFNMFDPADLPPRLAEYANMVYSACEDIGNFFGFQDSSVRNQAEHLLILLSNNRRYMSSHILPPSVQPPSPIHALHAKVFSNYMKWCRTMGVPPSFSKMNSSMSAPPAVASRVVDLVLFFCIWGEGANLRHMPECTWFLYHKMMEEYTLSEGYTQTRSLYAGHFVDNVVTPIFDIVCKVRSNEVLTLFSALHFVYLFILTCAFWFELVHARSLLIKRV